MGPAEQTRRPGRPRTRWTDDVKKEAENLWTRTAGTGTTGRITLRVKSGIANSGVKIKVNNVVENKLKITN